MGSEPHSAERLNITWIRCGERSSALLRGGWRASLNRFNLCSLVRLITIYKYRSGRTETEVSFKSNKIKTQSTLKYFSSKCKKVFPNSSCFSSEDRKPELLLCKLTNIILWYLLQVSFATGGSRSSFQPLLRDCCISLTTAP